MKTLFVALVALLFAFFIGCQSSITDPVVPESTKINGTSEDNTVNKDLFTFQYPNTIKLGGYLYDPSHKLHFALISGVVRYGITEVNTTGTSTVNEKIYKASIYANAELDGGCPDHNHLWTVGKRTEVTFQENNISQSVIYIEKSFRIANTCCAPLNLVLKFTVDEKELKLVSMTIKIAKGWARTTDEE